jgi:predicted PurR-regulated permease PerM
VISAAKFPGLVQAAGDRLQDLLTYAQSRLNSDAYARLRAAIASVQQNPTSIASGLQAWLLSGLAGLVTLGSSAIGLLIVPFFVYYLLLDLDKIRAGIDDRIPPRHRATAARLFDDIGDVLRGYVRGRLLVALGMAVFYTAGLWAVGVPVPAAIGLIAGIVGVVPYLGVVTGLVLALGFALLDGASMLHLVGVAGVFAAAQLLEDYVLTPRLIGDRLELHPLLVFVGLIVAGDLYGLLGLVLAIPALAILKVIVRFLDSLYLSSTFFAAPGARPVVASGSGDMAALPIEATADASSSSPSAAARLRPARAGKKRRA